MNTIVNCQIYIQLKLKEPKYSWAWLFSYIHVKMLQKSQRLNIGGDGSQVDSLEVGSNAC